MGLLLKIVFLSFILIWFYGCATDGMPKVIGIPTAFGVEDTKTGKLLKGCKAIPERNVQRCVKIDNNRTTFFEVPLGNTDKKIE